MTEADKGAFQGLKHNERFNTLQEIRHSEDAYRAEELEPLTVKVIFPLYFAFSAGFSRL